MAWFPQVSLRSRQESLRNRLLRQAMGVRPAALFESLETRLCLSSVSNDTNNPADTEALIDAGILPEVCPVAPGVLAADVAQTNATPQAALYPSNQTFLLHSLPGAARIVYLDFTGNVYTSGGWLGYNKYDVNGDLLPTAPPGQTPKAGEQGGPIITPPYTLDSDASLNFSNTELTTIQLIWQRVAEDYAPFQVDVTTEDPGVDANGVDTLKNTGAGDDHWGMRVVIGGYSWFGPGTGGVAFVGSFSGGNEPCWVYGGGLDFAAGASSHESGHTVGLLHHGTDIGGVHTEYYAGHGTGETGWGAIMGIGFSQHVCTWSKGDYANASNSHQDDLATISGGYIPYRVDDVGNTPATATPLTVNGTLVDSAGIIEQNTDFDVYSFTAGNGLLSLTVNPAPTGPNLDVLAELLDSNGTVIATANPPSSLMATLSVPVTQGKYYLRISGIGYGDPNPKDSNGVPIPGAVPTGYSKYSSIGQYTITGTVPLSNGFPSLSVGDVSVAEGNSGTTTASFPLTLSAASPDDITVLVSTADGTATLADGDYQALTNLLVTIPAGQTTVNVPVLVNGDTKNEANETFTVNLSGATFANLLTSTATGTITNDDAQPLLSVTGATVYEGNSGFTPATFTLSLSAVSGQTVTVNVSTADGTATVGNFDYVAVTNQTVTFLPGEVTKTYNVNVRGDSVAEADETFTLNLSSPTNATITTAQATGTIINDDGLPTLTVANVSAIEGNTGSKVMAFVLTLSQLSAQTVTFQVDSTDGTATVADGDYQALTAQTVTFLPGVISQTLNVTINGDTKYEPDEYFTLSFTNATHALIGTSSATGTILNDDALPVINLVPVVSTVTEGNSGTVAATYSVTLSNPSYQTVSVTLDTLDGTATVADGDYQSIAGQVITFAPGQTTQSVSVLVNGDTKYETDETFSLGLSGASNGSLGTNTATGSILNDDTLPQVSLTQLSQSVLEGNSGTSLATFTLAITNASYQAIDVVFDTTDGTATVASGDYQPLVGQLITFAPGQTTQSVSVLINGDTTFELDQTFSLAISSVSNASLDNSARTAVVTILNDDQQPSASFSSDQVSLLEGANGTQSLVPLSVVLSNASDFPLSVTVNTTDGSATLADNDYQPLVGQTIQFAPGQTSVSLGLMVNGDNKYETNQSFTVDLSNPSNDTLGLSHAIVTILNDDAKPTISVANASVLEGNVGTTQLQFTATLSNPSDESVSFAASTSDATATTLNHDYAALFPTNYTFAPGTTTLNVNVTVYSDRWFEPDETLLLNLFPASNGTIATSSATGTILNDDASGFAVGFAGTTSDTVTKGNPLTITANMQLDMGQSVKRIQVYRDVNENALYDSLTDPLAGTDTNSAGGWSVTLPTTKLPGGSVQFLVRAQNDQGVWSAFVPVVATINLPPTIGSLTVGPAGATVGQQDLTVTAVNAIDSDGAVDAVEFWRDVDGNGVLNVKVDQLIATDRNGSDGWSTTFATTTNFKPGLTKFLARAQDDRGAFGAFKSGSTTLLVGPKITSLTTDLPRSTRVPVSPPSVIQGSSLKISALGLSTAAGRGIVEVDFYLDSNANGLLDLTPGSSDAFIVSDTTSGDGWSISLDTSILSPGLHTFLARAVDSQGYVSNVVSTTVLVVTAQPAAGPALTVKQLAKLKSNQASLVSLSKLTTA